MRFPRGESEGEGRGGCVFAVLAESEYRKLTADELIAADRSLGDVGRLTLVSESLKTVSIASALDGSWSNDAGNALTAIANISRA